jgi:hypothetical protein
LREEALRPISIHIFGERATLSVTEAAIRFLATSAALGRPRELALFLDLPARCRE